MLSVARTAIMGTSVPAVAMATMPVARLAAAPILTRGLDLCRPLLSSASGTRSMSSLGAPATETGNLLLTLSNINNKVGRTLPSLSEVVMLGMQSAGKTTVLSAVTGLDVFETKNNMATKRPVFINVVKTTGGQPYARVGSFGENIYDEEKIRQLMLETNMGPLNPEPVEFTFFTPHSVDARYVDLPGYVAAGTRSQDPGIRKMIEEMNRPFVEDDNNIKMLVMPATTDFNNSLALAQVLECDQMANTVFVVTKIDKELAKSAQLAGPDGASGRGRIIDIMSDTQFNPGLGIYGCRLRSYDQKESGMGIQAMLQQETDFIAANNLGPEHCPNLHFGIPALRELITREQLHRISHNLPAYREELTHLIKRTEENQRLLRSLSGDVDRVDTIAANMTEAMESMGRNSPQRVVFERRLYHAIEDLVTQMVHTAAQTHFPNIENYRPKEQISTTPRTGDSFSSSSVLNAFRKGYNRMGGPSTHPEDREHFGELTKYGNCVNTFTPHEMVQSYKATTAQATALPFYQMEVTGKSAEYRTPWMRRINKIMDDLVKVHSLPEEARRLAVGEIISFVEESSGTSIDGGQSDSNLLFRYILDKIEENTNKVQLTEFLSWLVNAEKRPILDATWMSHHMAMRHSQPFYRETQNFLGMSTRPEEYPKYYPVFGPDWTWCYIEELKRQLSNRLYQMIGVNVSDPLLVDIMAHGIRFFQGTNFDVEEGKASLKLEEFRGFQDEIDDAIAKNKVMTEEKKEQQKAREAKAEEARLAQEKAEKAQQRRRRFSRFGDD